MADFLNTAAVVQKIDGIITGARKKLVLVSPYLQLSKNVFEQLQDAGRRKVKLVLVCREKDLKEEVWGSLLRLSRSGFGQNERKSAFPVTIPASFADWWLAKKRRFCSKSPVHRSNNRLVLSPESLF